MLRLLEAHLPEVHGAFWLCLLAPVQSQGGFQWHPSSSLCRPEGPRRGAALATDALGRLGLWNRGRGIARVLVLVCLVWFDAQSGVLDSFSSTRLFWAICVCWQRAGCLSSRWHPGPA